MGEDFAGAAVVDSAVAGRGRGVRAGARPPTSPPAQIVADTISRTVGHGVRIVDAALAGETTVLWRDLLVESRADARGAGSPRSTATPSSAGSPMSLSCDTGLSREA